MVTLLSLAVIGSINAIHHAWRRLAQATAELGEKTFFSELDVHRNILDFLSLLTIYLRKPAIADMPAADDPDVLRWQMEVLSYPALILFGLYTTVFSFRHMDRNTGNAIYVSICAGCQIAFSIPFIWRKLCRFVGEHRADDDGLIWTKKKEPFFTGLSRRRQSHKTSDTAKS